MATAFWGTMSIVHTDGTIEADRFDSTDVSLVFCTWKSNGGNTFYTVQKDGYIKDIVLNIASAGTTTYFSLFINQKDTGIKWVQSACFPALATHFPNLTPIPVKAGQQILIQCVT